MSQARLDLRCKMQAYQLESKLCWFVGIVLIGLILVGCGPRENRDVIVARKAIVLANMV